MAANLQNIYILFLKSINPYAPHPLPYSSPSFLKSVCQSTNIEHPSFNPNFCLSTTLLLICNFLIYIVFSHMNRIKALTGQKSILLLRKYFCTHRFSTIYKPKLQYLRPMSFYSFFPKESFTLNFNHCKWEY